VKGRVLLVDDDRTLRMAVRDRLEHWGLAVDEAADGDAALRAAAEREHDLVLLDLAMPGLDGLAVLRRLKETGNAADVVMLTAQGSIESAVEAIRAGAADFLTKPADFTLLRARVGALLDRRKDRRRLEALADAAADDPGLVAPRSDAMKRLLDVAERAAASDATVLVTGESGTGKQVLAELLHRRSPRHAAAFVYVNCVALSDELVESTLFGHEKGAFTGAVERKRGRLELAAGGTAFLDEIGDTTERLQTKLLHFLESGEYERVGGTATLTADCRVVAATSRDLEARIAEGRFRADLFYRLNVIRLVVPPLRDRREDVAPLAEAFAARFSRRLGRGPFRFAPATMERLQAWSWPGNVRELRNLVERMAVLAPGDLLSPDLLPDEFFHAAAPAPAAPGGRQSLRDAVAAFKRSYIARALEEAGGNQTRAAELLGMQRTFLNRLLREMGLREGDGE
jgi:DNA-binding NtrC family response regulator